MKKAILFIGTKIESSYRAISIITLLLLSAYILFDNLYSWPPRVDKGFLISVGKEIAGIGVIAASIAFAYFIVRTILVFMSNKTIRLPHLIDGTLKTTLSFLRMIHPAIGTIAVALLSVHGYTIMKYELAGQIDPLAVSGSTALAAGFSLLIAGILLYRKRADIRVRRVHRTIAIVCAIIATVHLIAVNIIG